MKTESVSKIKYLKIWDILRQETDEQHPISTPDLIARLEACGIACDRRTLYRNIEELNEYGYEILVKKGKPNGYYVEDRSFDIPEIQILMDAVQAASFITDNETLDDKLKRAEERIATLVQENMSLTAKCNSLQTALTKSEAVQLIIEPSNIPEFFEGEQHDLLVSILQKALSNCGSKDTRQKELITDLLVHNQLIGNGKEMLEVVKSIFADGEELSAKELTELKRVGFEITSDNTHYKLVYKGSKYWFSLAKTSSDKKRSGKNLTSDITKTLSVYKK